MCRTSFAICWRGWIDRTAGIDTGKRRSSPSRARRLGCGFLLLFLTGCCLHGRPIDGDRFARSDLDEKIRLYEDAIARKCVTNDMLQLLTGIASHGEAAADAMASLFGDPHRHFPLEHAMFVFEFTRYEGVDLLGHEGMVELRRLAASGPDERTRQLAVMKIREIESHYARGSPTPQP